MNDLLGFVRGFTSTPIARRYEANLGARSRHKGSIAWDRFDAGAHSPAALALAARAYQELAASEYGTSAVFARVLDAMIVCGAPFDVIAEAAQAPLDELRHADHALRLVALCGGEPMVFGIDRERIDPARSHARTPSELDAVLVDLSAIGETIAAAWIAESAQAATDPVVLDVLSDIAADEVHHARLGWHYLAWRSPQWSVAERQHVADRAAAVVDHLRGIDPPAGDVPPALEDEAAALGVLDTRARRAALVRVMEEEIVPGLDAFGLNASYVWFRET